MDQRTGSCFSGRKEKKPVLNTAIDIAEKQYGMGDQKKVFSQTAKNISSFEFE